VVICFGGYISRMSGFWEWISGFWAFRGDWFGAVFGEQDCVLVCELFMVLFGGKDDGGW
jgi:hypothetical protein